MKVNGTSWVGLGWRPRDLTAECRNFPRIRDSWDREGEPEPEPKSEPEPEPAGEPEPTVEPEPSSEPEAEPKSEPEPKVPSVVSSKSKRVVANEETTNKEGITLSTSVSYRVSAKAGRRRRATSNIS